MTTNYLDDALDFCEWNNNEKHEPDFMSISHSDNAVGDITKECIFDVNCIHCGRTGSIRLDLTTDTNWR